MTLLPSAICVASAGIGVWALSVAANRAARAAELLAGACLQSRPAGVETRVAELEASTVALRRAVEDRLGR